MIPTEVKINTHILFTGGLAIVEENGLKGRYIKPNYKTKRNKVVSWENRICIPTFEVFKNIKQHAIDKDCFEKFAATRPNYPKEYEDVVDFLRKTDDVVNSACIEIESKIFGLCGKLASLGSKNIFIVYRQPMTILFSSPFNKGDVVAAFVDLGIYSED